MSSGEKRRYPRLSLKIDDGIFGHFLLPGPDQTKLVASIMNLSAGGINVAVSSSFKDKIRQYDILLLKQVVGVRNLAFLSDIKRKFAGSKNWSPPIMYPWGANSASLWIRCDGKSVNWCIRNA
jgi:hypothetical protein